MNRLQNFNVILLGACGFIGSRIGARLARDAQFSLTSFGSGDLDLLDKTKVAEALLNARPEGTVIFAAGTPRLSRDGPEDMLDNIRMVHNVLSAFTCGQRRRVIFLSSVEVYGNETNIPIDERSSLCPETDYAIGKIAAEMIVRRWARQGAAAVILRLPGVFGIGDEGKGLIGTLAEAALNNSEFTLTGNGGSVRDYLYVEDAAELVGQLAALATWPPDDENTVTLNAAPGQPQTIDELIEMAGAGIGAFRIVRAERRSTGSFVFR